MTSGTMSNIQEICDANRILQAPRRPLDAIFAPCAVAVVGATENPGSVGSAIMRNLTDGQFRGNVYPVNPKRATVYDRAAFRSVGAIGKPVDLAVIAAPAAAVSDIVGECADAGVRGAVIISAGF